MTNTPSDPGNQQPFGAQPPTGNGGYPPAGPQPPYGAGSGSEGGAKAKGFFGALFDFSFNHFVTPIIVKIVYILVLIALVIGWLIAVISGFAQNVGVGLLFLVLGAIGVIVYLALIRMTLELYLSIVRMSEDIHHRLPRN